MISILLDHYTIKSCRRALLISSFVAIMIPSLTITGQGLNFFGAVLELRQETLLSSARVISFYFLWTFLWLNLASAMNSFQPKISKFFNEKIEAHREAAYSVDVNPNEQDQWEPDIEPWWIHFQKLEKKLLRRGVFARAFTNIISGIAIGFVEYVPPILLGVLAIFSPTYANELIFGLLT